MSLYRSDGSARGPHPSAEVSEHWIILLLPQEEASPPTRELTENKTDN